MNESPKYSPEPRYYMHHSRPLACYIVSDGAGDYRGCPHTLVSHYKNQANAAFICNMLNAVSND